MRNNKYKNFVFTAIIGLLMQISIFAQPKTVSFSALEKLMQTNPKPIIIFLHTPWCSYCILMEKKTWQNEALVNRLNSDFYFLSFDAEQKNDIIFCNKTYRFQKMGIKGGVHQLAQLFSSKNEYPTIVFFNKNFEKIYEHNAYIKPEKLHTILDLLHFN